MGTSPQQRVGTSPSHPWPKRIFSTDLNRNRVITAKKNNDVLCTSPHQGRVGTSPQRESVRCAQGRSKFSNQKKSSPFQKMWCVCESWNKGVGTSPLMTGVVDLYQEGGFKCWKTRVWKYVTYRKESCASECTSPLFFKTQPQFSGDTEILNWGVLLMRNLLHLDVASCLQRTMNALVCQGGCICLFKWH